jgi:hypothetical protein
LAHRFLNAYLEASGDYSGVGVLRFYCVYRALVRAKVSCIRAHQSHVRAPERARAMREYHGHLRLAARLATSARSALILTHGLSGSGKTFIAQQLLESLGAIRVRSDVERKRLRGLAATARTGSGIDSGLYATEANTQIYARLQAVAKNLLAAGYPVIVDAAFLLRRQRDLFRVMAQDLGVPFAIACCRAGTDTLRGRVARRERSGVDASDAGIAVLEQQQATQEPLGADEKPYVVDIDTEAGEPARGEATRTLARRLGLDTA